MQAPYHGFAAKLYKHAAEPSSPLNPFSPACCPVRAAAVALYAEAVRGARGRVPVALRDRLPVLRSLTRQLLGVLDGVLR